MADLVVTLQELHELGVGFISLNEALDLTTSTGREMAGMLAVFAEFERGILRERVKAGIAEARRRGQRPGRSPTVAHRADDGRFTASKHGESRPAQTLVRSRALVQVVRRLGARAVVRS